MEFALVVVLFLTLVFGIVQYSYYFYQSQGASSTVREASRLAAVGVDSCATFEAEVEDAASDNGLPVSAIRSISLSFTGGAAAAIERGDVATVTLTFEPEKFGFPFVPFLSGNDTEKARTRVEDLGTLVATSC